MSLASVGNFFKHLGEKIHSALVAMFGQDALDKVETELKTVLSDSVRVIFVDAIQAAESLTAGGAPASGSQKRDAAFQKITSDLKGQGIVLEQNIVNLGIELVVGLLKAKQPA